MCSARGGAARARHAHPIDAEKRGVLGDEQQLANAPLGERARLADDRVGRSAAIRATQRRDDAERARVVAALGDLDVGKVARRREVAWRVGVVEVVGDAGDGRGIAGSGSSLDSEGWPTDVFFKELEERLPGRSDRIPEPRGAPSRSRLQICGTSPVPSTASISGISRCSSSR